MGFGEPVKPEQFQPKPEKSKKAEYVPMTEDEIQRKKQEMDKAWTASEQRNKKEASITNHEIEALREKILLQRVLEDGGAAMHTSLSVDMAADLGLTSGFQDLVQEKRLDQKGYHGSDIFTSFKEIKDELEKNGINEAVYVKPVKEPVYSENDVTVTESKLFGLLKKETVKKERKFVGEKEKLHEQVVAGGKKEALYELIYQTIDDYSNPQYLEPGTSSTVRGGNFLGIKIALPKSTAEEVLGQIKKDPGFLRKIVEEAVMKELKIPLAAWNGEGKYGRPIRPPYEKWLAKKGKAKIYIRDSDDEYGKEFKPENVLGLNKEEAQPVSKERKSTKIESSNEAMPEKSKKTEYVPMTEDEIQRKKQDMDKSWTASEQRKKKEASTTKEEKSTKIESSNEAKLENKTKIKYNATEYGLYTPSKAAELQEKIEKLSLADVGTFLIKRAAKYDEGDEQNNLTQLGSSLNEKNNGKDLMAALKIVERAYDASSYDFKYEKGRHTRVEKARDVDLDAMRHFIKRRLQEVQEEDELKKYRQGVGLAVNTLERGLGESIRLDKLKIGNDTFLWGKLSKGLEQIRKSWVKDNEPAFKKADKYKRQIQDLFTSITE